MREIYDILLYILLDDKPRSTTKAESLALSDGAKPVSFMLSHQFSGFHLYGIALPFTEVTTQIVIIIYLSKEANALRILSFRIDKMIFLCNMAHFFLIETADRKECFLQLPVVNLCEEVGLVFHWVRRSDEPLSSFCIYLSLSIVSSGYKVVFMAFFLIESTKLYQPVAHHIRVGSEAHTHLIHRVFRHFIPVFTMTIHHFKLAVIATAQGCSHLKVLLRCAIPVFCLLRTYLYIEAIRLDALTTEHVKHYGRIHSTA